MRIISGTHKGRLVRPPKFFKDRPTTDMAKEALFNILHNSFVFEEISILDLFSGSGSISFEFASRGCQNITCVEKNFKYSEFIKKIANEFGFDSHKVIKSDVFSYLKRSLDKFDIIFADPPYDLPDLVEIPDFVFDNDILNRGGLLIVEHPDKINFSRHPNFIDNRNYSRVNFSFFKHSKD